MVEIEAIVIVTVSQMIVLHLVPPKPVPVQLHEKAPRRLVQLPPLEQGFDAHSSISWPPDKFDLIFVADVNVLGGGGDIEKEGNENEQTDK